MVPTHVSFVKTLAQIVKDLVEQITEIMMNIKIIKIIMMKKKMIKFSRF